MRALEKTNALKVSVWSRGLFGKFFKPVFVVSIEADPALSVPYGNDLQFPGVFGKWYLYVVPGGHFRILELV
jgi:hypothetical protein